MFAARRVALSRMASYHELPGDSTALLDDEEDFIMSLQFQCPHCNSLLSASADKSGSVVSCGICHQDMVVPNVAPPVALPVPTNPVVFFPHIDTEPIRDKKPRRGIPLPLELLTVGVLGLLLVVGGVIFFSVPSNNGHQGNGPVAVKSKAKLQAGNGPVAVKSKAKLQAQPDDSGEGPFNLDGEEVGALLLNSAVIVIFGLAFLLYFMPTFIAGTRRHKNAAAIAVLNLLLGWTFIGWVAALVWSFTEARSRDHYHYHR